MKTEIRVSASQLKAELGRHLRVVRAGAEIVVTVRGEPAARIVPYREASAPRGDLGLVPADPAAPRFGDIEVRPIRYRGPSPTAGLEEDRTRR
jgi:prevent-host-death family protein